MGPKVDWPTVLGIVVAAGVLIFGWNAIWILPAALIGIVLSVLVVQAAQYFATNRALRQHRLRMFESDYGRLSGWFVEIDGRRVAALEDAQFVDMFWDSYHINALTEDLEERRRILTDSSWWGASNLVFRNREFDEVAAHAFAATGNIEGDRIVMRGLCLETRTANWWEQILLYLRSRRVR